MESVSDVYRLGSFELSSPVMIAGNGSYINTRITLFLKQKQIGTNEKMFSGAKVLLSR